MKYHFILLLICIVLYNVESVYKSFTKVSSGLGRGGRLGRFIIQRKKYLEHVQAEDINSTMHSVKKEDCLLRCHQVKENCLAINIEEVEVNSAIVNCQFINKQAFKFTEVDADKKTVVVKGQTKRCSANCRVGICGRCKCLDFCNSRYPMLCDCTKVHDLNAKSCEEAVRNVNVSGIYELSLPNGTTMKVLCEIKQNNIVWTLLMQRDQTEEFPVEVTEYIDGFGDFAHYYWLGLNNLYALTSTNEMILHVEYTTEDNLKRIYEYDGFEINDNQTYAMMYKRFAPKVSSECPELQCPNSRTCISRNHLCNNYVTPDCENYEDERYCGSIIYENTYADGEWNDVVNTAYEQSASSCYIFCAENKVTHNTINGVSIRNDGHCRCNQNMGSITVYWQVCKIVNDHCTFVYGNIYNNYYQTDRYSGSAESCKTVCIDHGSKAIDYYKPSCYCYSSTKYYREFSTTYYYKTLKFNHVTTTCPARHLFCDGRCIDGSKVCDNVYDCKDGLDETFCSKNHENNLKCSAGEAFGACSNEKGVWWGAKCEGETGPLTHLTVPTSRNSINWAHDRNLKFIKMKFRISPTSHLTPIASCKDVVKYQRCSISKNYLVDPDGGGNVYVACRSMGHSIILGRVQTIYYMRHRDDELIDDANRFYYNYMEGNRYLWVGIYNLNRFMKIPKDLFVKVWMSGNQNKAGLMINFTVLPTNGYSFSYDKYSNGNDGYTTSQIAPLYEFMASYKNNSFQKCSNITIGYWWGCKYYHPMELKYYRYHGGGLFNLFQLYTIDQL